jgi:hypothetical protein
MMDPLDQVKDTLLYKVKNYWSSPLRQCAIVVLQDKFTQDLFHQLIQGNVTLMCQFHEFVPLVVIKFDFHCGSARC